MIFLNWSWFHLKSELKWVEKRLRQNHYFSFTLCASGKAIDPKREIYVYLCVGPNKLSYISCLNSWHIESCSISKAHTAAVAIVHTFRPRHTHNTPIRKRCFTCKPNEHKPKRKWAGGMGNQKEGPRVAKRSLFDIVFWNPKIHLFARFGAFGVISFIPCVGNDGIFTNGTHWDQMKIYTHTHTYINIHALKGYREKERKRNNLEREPRKNWEKKK